MRLRAKAYVWFVGLTGLAVLGLRLLGWESSNPARFYTYVALVVLTSVFRINLPGSAGTLSVNSLLVLIGLVDTSFSECMLLGFVGVLVQSVIKPPAGFNALRTFFQVGTMAIAIEFAYRLQHWRIAVDLNDGAPVLIVLTATVYLLLVTGPAAILAWLTNGKSLIRAWYDIYSWALPVHLVGACVAWVISLRTLQSRWDASLLLLPVLYYIYRSYRSYLARLEDEKAHVEDMAGLHLRTIEALALAIEAKDQSTHDHLRRVRTYAVEIGKEMGLTASELEALRAAALLHDIGKLAVPEHILSKPGKLTPEEFDKMKIHPLVGAEILERVRFPYPVVPIVRAHHEKWDGTGYPAGLKREEIPLGARILAVVDTLDALASDRQYRRALPLEDAMRHIKAQAGRSLDPAVVEILSRRCEELEEKAKAEPLPDTRLSLHVKVERGKAPDTGLERPWPGPEPEQAFLDTIAAARQEVQLLFELSHDLGTSLSLAETLSTLAFRLKPMIPYDSIAVYIRRGNRLVPEYVNGEDFRLFSSLEIPMGAGVSGWVAENRKPILNGEPWIESAHLHDPNRWTALGSALSAPLEGVDGVLGVLSLYRAAKEAFNKDHLRILLAVNSKVSLAIENALKFRQAQNSATTDYLTNLPNARSLFLRLESDVARAKRMQESVAVLLCDLDGFKQINDRFGHLEGNRILRAVADALRNNCRQYDYVARLGGDEFVLVLPGSDRVGVTRRISELKRAVRDAAAEVIGTEVLSLSVGEAFFPNDGIDPEQLVAEADRRMYAAKQRGKLQASVNLPPHGLMATQ